MPEKDPKSNEARATELAEEDLQAVQAGAAKFKSRTATAEKREVVPDGFVQTFPRRFPFD